MSQSVAFWGIFTHKGERHLLFRYANKFAMYRTLVSLNRERVKELYYFALVKESIRDLPKQFVSIDFDDREIKIPFVTPEGEKRLARKFFRDITVVWISEGKYRFTDLMTAHRYKGELRVKYNDHSYPFEDFEKLANERWPENADTILDPIWSI